MRQCVQCQREDRPQLDNLTECTCAAQSPEPMAHSANCRSVMHEVLLYRLRIDPKELTIAGNLQTSHLMKGWKLNQDGMRWYRVKMLCRQCIIAQEVQQAFKREYLKACKAARGQDDQTYAQMIAAQD